MAEVKPFHEYIQPVRPLPASMLPTTRPSLIDRRPKQMAVVAITLIAAMLAIGFWLQGGQPQLRHCDPPRFATVAPDHMVWDIAREQVSGTSRDVRDVSEDILAFNGLGQSTPIAAGTRVEIPC